VHLAQAAQDAGLSVLGASLLMVAAMLVQELMGDGRDEAAAKPNAAAPGPTMREGEEEGAAAARPKKAAQAEAEAEAQAQEDEAGRLATALGALVLYSPVLVACGLGCYKAWPLVQALR
jgi:ribosomal protein L12E/L44/L45/RPP1/RPP2